MSLVCQARVGTVGRWASSTELHRHIPALTKLTVLKTLHSWRSSFSWFSVERLRSQDRDHLGRGMGRAEGGGKDQTVEAQEGLVGKQVPASERRKEKSGEEPWGPWSQWPTRQRVWAPGGRSPGQASQSVTAKRPQPETSRNGLIELKVWHGGFPSIFVKAEEQDLSFSVVPRLQVEMVKAGVWLHCSPEFELMHIYGVELPSFWLITLSGLICFPALVSSGPPWVSWPAPVTVITHICAFFPRCPCFPRPLTDKDTHCRKCQSKNNGIFNKSLMSIRLFYMSVFFWKKIQKT